jgi:hypothetical protein
VILCFVIDGHEWVQALPLHDHVLVCMGCDARKPMGTGWEGDSCAKRQALKYGFEYGGD